MEIRAERLFQLAGAMGVDRDSLRFEAVAIRSCTRPALTTFNGDHDETVAWAAEMVEHFGPVATQTTITARVTPYVHGLFAVRHLTENSDSGWRIHFPGRVSVASLPPAVQESANGDRLELVEFTCPGCGFEGSHFVRDGDPDANRCGDCREANRRAALAV
jgi:hypothetical protein